MSSTSHPVGPVAERVTGATTLGRMVLSAQERGTDIALRVSTPRGEGTITYGEMGERSRELARGLIALGIEAGEVVSILCSTKAEWTLCELGAVCAGAVVAPIYPTSSPEECRHVLADSQAKLVFCENAEQIAKIAQIKRELSDLQYVIGVDGNADGAVPIEAVRATARETDPRAVDERVGAVAPEDVATLVYTSGTTGPPRGCMLTHANFLSATAMYRGQLELDGIQPVIYMFLPLAHVLARLAQTVMLDVGGTIAYWSGDSAKIADELLAFAPTHFVAVPRIYEKMHTSVMGAVEGSGPHVRTLFGWALEVGRRARAAERAGKPPGRLARARLGLADRLALAKVRGLFGERLTMALVGAAPIDPELLAFFDACGVSVLEGYGMTESCATATLNPAHAPHFGTVGKALPDSEVMVTEEGEILLRGPNVFVGYHRDPEATRATLTDGWLHSGDLGELSNDGYLTVTGRKKDLIITAGGKNIAPANIENALRETRWISEAVLYGDRRPYLVCLLTLDADEAPKLAQQLGLSADVHMMAQDKRVREAIQAVIGDINQHFARVEQIRRFAILDHDLTEEAGELTPTLKVKRAVVYERYADVFNALYEDEAAPGR